MSFQDRYTALNDAQKQAVDTIEGPVMVIAGPGTGKTELLSVRAANILQKTDTLPENILCLTFTESGQNAMRKRLVGIIGKDAYKVAIHTFHSFGSEIMNHNREYFYRGAKFEPADDLKQYEILRGIFDELPYTSPLAGTMNGEYTYLGDTKNVISELKRNSALTSDELLAVIEQSEASLDTLERLLMPILSERVGKNTADKLRDVLDLVHEHANSLESLHEVPPLGKIIADSLETMLEDTISVHPTKPISAWKASWCAKNDAKQLIFKDRNSLTKLRSVSNIYFEYLRRMEKAGLYDFDDMIMQVVHAIETQDDLRYNLQEKYLYIMVDEFQDTNLAQLRILHSLTNNPVNEGRPNVLVVGDDDQAIYGFQGADSSNIINFSLNYPERRLIVLTNNYRSGDNILKTSRAVIQQSTDRLETTIPELDKKLTAKQGTEGSVTLIEASSSDSERHEIVRRIAESIKQGTDPSSIAVLARRHHELRSLLPFFSRAGITVRYEKEESILDSAPILLLELAARTVLALAKGKHEEAQQYLPELLAHPAWGVSPKDLWRLSLDAYNSRQNWMEIMESSPAFTAIHEWLIKQAASSQTETLEPMLDALIGKPSDDSEASPLFNYFFSPETLNNDPDTYLEYLGALRTIRARLRNHENSENLTLENYISFVDLHRRLDVPIIAKRPSTSSDTSAVELLTAHKSKGLEYDTVYVFNSIDSAWGQSTRSRSRNISYPKNLPLSPAGETPNERLRLFYVAMTRAKNNLVLTYSNSDDKDKDTSVADFLLDIDAPTVKADTSVDTKLAIESAELAWYEPLTKVSSDLKETLAPQLEKFKLSATSLNSFLDVSRGGPQHFLLNNLLHFPQAKGTAAAYGTAVHWTMQQAHTHFVATGSQKPLEDSLQDFEVALKKERLSKDDYEHYLEQGSDHISKFFNSGVLTLKSTQKAEATFNHQDVRLGEAKLTGSLDMIDVNTQEREISVTDYKTGKPTGEWGKGSTYTKLKLHKYRQQLIFYKILVENSSEYSSYRVTDGHLAFIEPSKSGESLTLTTTYDAEEVERTKNLIQAVWKKIINLDLPDVSEYSEDLAGVLAFEQALLDETV